jgi:hypothetical protein
MIYQVLKYLKNKLVGNALYDGYTSLETQFVKKFFLYPLNENSDENEVIIRIAKKCKKCSNFVGSLDQDFCALHNDDICVLLQTENDDNNSTNFNFNKKTFKDFKILNTIKGKFLTENNFCSFLLEGDLVVKIIKLK